MADPGFPRERVGGSTQKVRAPTYSFGQLFLQVAWKWKELDLMIPQTLIHQQETPQPRGYLPTSNGHVKHSRMKVTFKIITPKSHIQFNQPGNSTCKMPPNNFFYCVKIFSPPWYLYVDESVNNYVDCILEAEFARQVLSSSRRLSYLPGDKESILDTVSVSST